MPIEASPSPVTDATAKTPILIYIYIYTHIYIDIRLGSRVDNGSIEIKMPPEPDYVHDGPNPRPCIANLKAKALQLQQLYKRAEENQRKGWASHRLEHGNNLTSGRSCRQADICGDFRNWYNTSLQEQTYESLEAFDDLPILDDRKVNSFLDQRKRLAKLCEKGAGASYEGGQPNEPGLSSTDPPPFPY